jgi:uncharacterized protein YndB with AHSA1/START domain
MTTTDSPKQDFTLHWTLDSPRGDVFRAWTDPDRLDWFYNDQQPIPTEPIELDLRVGGVWRQKMVIDHDTAYFTGGVYREIVTDEKLVFTWGATDGWPEIDLARLDDSPLVTVTFAETDDGTHMSVRVEVPETLIDDHKPGWWSMVRQGMQATVDRLAAQLASSATAV